MKRAVVGLTAPILGAVVLAGCATTTMGPPDPVAGYLNRGQLETLAAAAPEPPLANSVEQAQDAVLSERLRALEDTDRWWMATAHAELRPPEAAQHFDCILGSRLAQRPRPALDRLMGRLLADSERLTVELAEHRPRLRPLAVDPERRACQRVNAATRNGATSYPASGAVAGAVYGEMFADLAPDQAEAVRRMGGQIGFSRAICATNWPSDVAAGQALGISLYQMSASQPDFTLELEAARQEVAAARAEGLTNPGCASERLALAQGAAVTGN